ncbi:NAD(P)(+) transhydrogenase (Re/Si-specific) subunit beta [Rhodococcus sp. BP-349]|jgi:NAD(P) transhydrogenase subunit beta|uniref:NAD(P)(+) transhydrogenase (Re/Si-specific) subunit beta n=1 Tax=unclassified Rhodococcus (in: high G+C Gram-positive bacteria) TaxID=192944 RepID=UPI001C9A5F47|nr:MULTISPECIES: NAD(P)(+) transhydrogenase (Re/Si-specific) subunit beta [unclassified Rhodococcus (in: high G+C Gram-positive bacteria)]MBY6540194.1 NAD(P)(+) transhydrogenase (Re/Si-specific) subunit beta [Rhodococcus sp. BP-363]MBY6543478.1 NAD(P)(+) transhydrogenase (Re/Si-specific) subunit beta [Rhodococcus sp. BP-369]MBY6562708.1 NAD(P)(+) transhydrogenase (Re/Si-specific) subunit beta [Rhodococcus sp. BP-370]MBY6577000.1 NAD(P)(+) transhydrogenase (Re/Si-specific) subunit beta [Rhodococ
MNNLVNILYIVAFAMFIYGLMGLTGPKTAVRGNWIAAVGMGIAVVATLIEVRDTAAINWILIAAGLAIGVLLGVPPAKRTKMTAMPQLVALFNGVGGGTVALIAWSEFIETDGFSAFQHGEEPTVHIVIGSLFAAVIGSVSFWGSLVAFLKLQELLNKKVEKAFVKNARIFQLTNIVLLLLAVAVSVYIGLRATPGEGTSQWWIVLVLVAAALMGLFVVFPIGGADMPVVISLLNALTGLSAAAAGLALNNTAMIVAGMIVGASGTILTNLMATAMNRSIPAIVFGSFGGGGGAAVGGPDDAGGTVKSTSAADAAIQMAYASQVIVVPGYGLAVAQAQHAVKDMASILESKGVEVKYAIHPVAGRMPGHMNVLLAEADVEYEAMKEMDDINGEFSRTDVTLVIGANDVTNPAARNDPSSPIHGMPILNVDESRSVIVLKRSMSSGYAGIDNPLFTADRTSMLFGDAKKSVNAVIEELKAL